MKPVKAVILLTIPRFFLLWFFIATVSLQSNAQCGSPNKISYHVTLSGTGNNSWGFVFPQFDPSVGTLVAVDIRSEISVNVNFQLFNIGASADTYTVLAGRNDNLTVSALSSPISNAYPVDYGPYILQAGQDTVGAGSVSSPQFFSLMSDYVVNDSINSAVAGFLGTSWVVFNNNPYTYTSVISGSNYDLLNTFSDTMKISLTYYYCTANILATDISAFTVTKESNELAKLNWATENEVAGRNYEVEESPDGKFFNGIASVASLPNGDGTGNYDYDYAIAAGTTGKLYFRIKQINGDGYTKYSAIRSIDIDHSGIYLYPSPADNFINIVFNMPSSNGWQADIFAADGSLVQRNYFVSGGTAHIDFLHRLAKGVYFLRATDKQTQKMQTQSFVVR